MTEIQPGPARVSLAPTLSTKTKPICEFARAYLELLGAVPSEAQDHGCSHEPPESREYPAPRGGEVRYVLCNGHLRDIYSSLENSKPVPPSAQH
jgi:hypothetical protein